MIPIAPPAVRWLTLWLILTMLAAAMPGGVRADTTPNRLQHLSAHQAARLVRSGTPILLDVRSPAEFRHSRLRNAVLIPIMQLPRHMADLAAHKDRDILVYCATGGRSHLVARYLSARGFRRVYNLRGGIVEWDRQRLPIVR